MARLNVEDSLFSDIRYQLLVGRLGDPFKALGCVVMAYRLAQRHWVPDKKGIPIKEWELYSFPEDLEQVGIVKRRLADPSTGLAEIYVSGSESNFAWLIQKTEAGRLGGQKKEKNKKTSARLKVEKKLAKSSVELAESSGAYPLTLTLTPSLTLSKNKERITRDARDPICQVQTENAVPQDNESQNISDEATPSPDTSGLQALCRSSWQAYVAAFQKRYGIEPLRNAKVNAQVKKFCQDVGADAPLVLEFYLSHNESFYLANQHAFGFALTNSSQLYTQFKRGRAVTRSDVKAFEKHDALRAQIERIERGEI